MLKKVIAVILCTLFLCTGCGEKSIDKQLVGNWRLEGGREDRFTEIVFYKDGSYKHANNYDGDEELNVSGDYKVVSDDEIELTSSTSGLGSDMFHIAGIHGFSLEGDTLTIKGGGGQGTYYKAK